MLLLSEVIMYTKQWNRCKFRKKYLRSQTAQFGVVIQMHILKTQRFFKLQDCFKAISRTRSISTGKDRVSKHARTISSPKVLVAQSDQFATCNRSVKARFCRALLWRTTCGSVQEANKAHVVMTTLCTTVEKSWVKRNLAPPEVFM